jgi:hypothetical protein
MWVSLPLHEYGSGGKSSTWGSGEAFEEDIDGDQDAVFLADEVSGMDVVHADSGGGLVGKREGCEVGGRRRFGEKRNAVETAETL